MYGFCSDELKLSLDQGREFEAREKKLWIKEDSLVLKQKKEI